MSPETLSHKIEELCKLGLTLSSEKDIDNLLGILVSVARQLTNAEGCTLYLCNEELAELDFAVGQNENLDIYQAGSGAESDWPSVLLFFEDGSENHSNASAHCVLTGQTVMISDVYDEEGFDFSSTRAFDREVGYRSRSMLLIPMMDTDDNVIGVLQLLNARSEESGEICDFSSDSAEMVRGLASQASVAVDNVRLINRINKYARLGVALSAEKDIHTLLQMIAEMARRHSHAEGCTVYVCNEDKTSLDFGAIQNEKLDIDINREDGKKEWPSINLYHADGRENHSNASAHCALTRQTVNIADVYDEEGFDFSGTREFDAKSGYRSRSMLLIPMTDHEDEVIGVLQLLNARKGISRKVCSFSEEDIPMVRGLASQAAVAVSNVRLVQGMEKLLKTFVQCIATAIDEKSPYTAGHIQRVVTLTEMLADKINQTDSGCFADISFSEDKMEEISMAAWMHDVGKIATPEYVVDKATKLETIYDRIELVRLRIELMKREQEIRQLRAGLPETVLQGDSEQEQDHTDLDAVFQFLCRINVGGEFMREEDLEKLGEVAAMSYMLEGKPAPLLNKNEADCCAIQRGTLTAEELLLVKHHNVVTIMMLENLPFPQKWKFVPEYAGMHHEKIDGSGYPTGVAGEDISLPARILAVADIFEALTAADRPYKSGKKLSESMQIMEKMAETGHLDEKLCDFLVESGVANEYAALHLGEKQKDSYCWKGKEYHP